MAYLLAGLALLAVGLLLMRGFTRVQPSLMARVLRAVGGFLALAAAVVLLVRGAIGAAIPLATVGLWLLSASQRQSWGLGSGSEGRASTVETATLDMELDLDTGAVRGSVKRGPFAGRMLDEMSPAEVARLWADCGFDDPQSAQILEAYLDRRHPTWRDDLDRSGDRSGDRFGDTGSGRAKGADTRTGPMTADEARRVLGVGPNASRDEIVRAHKARMMECHPDRGGSTEAAARVNEAKAILLGR